MKTQKEEAGSVSRRTILKGSALLLTGGIAGKGLLRGRATQTT
jgi:hypothetical protein